MYCNTEEIKFANIIFNRDILNCIDYKLLSKNEKDSIRDYYYGIKNNKEIVMYAKNWNNGDCDKIKMYSSYEDAINDLYIPITSTMVCINLIIACFYILIIGGYLANVAET